MRTNQESGREGEQAAAKKLQENGYQIIARNFKMRQGEIDIIAQNETFLVFAEVKTRKNQKFAQAREFVTQSKQKKLLLAAQDWLSKFPTELQPRFDVIEVYWQNDAAEPYQICWIQNAFDA